MTGSTRSRRTERRRDRCAVGVAAGRAATAAPPISGCRRTSRPGRPRKAGAGVSDAVHLGEPLPNRRPDSVPPVLWVHARSHDRVRDGVTRSSPMAADRTRSALASGRGGGANDDVLRAPLVDWMWHRMRHRGCGLSMAFRRAHRSRPGHEGISCGTRSRCADSSRWGSPSNRIRGTVVPSPTCRRQQASLSDDVPVEDRFAGRAPRPARVRTAIGGEVTHDAQSCEMNVLVPLSRADGEHVKMAACTDTPTRRRSSPQNDPGSPANARAMATRCFTPPESCDWAFLVAARSTAPRRGSRAASHRLSSARRVTKVRVITGGPMPRLRRVGFWNDLVARTWSSGRRRGPAHC